MKRICKSINISSIEKIPVGEIKNIPNLKQIIFTETYSAIKEAYSSSQEKATLFEINNSGYILELKKDYWSSALWEAIVYYENLEEFENCVLCKNLITQLNEQLNEPRNQQNSPSNKRYTKRRNSIKEKKKK